MLSSSLSKVLLPLCLLLLASVSEALSTPTKRATVCNGHAELCGRGYGNTTFVTSHNAFAYSLLPAALARTQQVSVSSQLRLGVRALQAQSHMKDGKLHFCHTTCGLFDGGTVLNFLKTVKTFLDANPNEVITLIFTNPEGVSLTGVWKPIFDEAGITPLAYAPATPPVKRSDWPTLGQMIDSGKRVVVFMDDGADIAQVNFILPQFPMMWEDPFSPTNPAFPCRIDRTAGPLSDDDHLHLINHNLNVDLIPGDIGEVLISDFINAKKTNAMSSILAHASGCSSFSRGRAPNFVLLDYVDIGEGKAAVERLNGF